MRLWPCEFVAWAGRSWNLVQDVYWWSRDAKPLTGTNRKQGLLRQSVKMCVWLGSPDCRRNQENVLWLPSDDIFAGHKSDAATRRSRIRRNRRNEAIAEAAEERGGSTPCNLLPIPVGGASGRDVRHAATRPYEAGSW